MKRSMNANIFLKQFKASHEEIVQMIKDGDTTKIGAERLRGLHKILPDKDEVRLDSSYSQIQAFFKKFNLLILVVRVLMLIIFSF